MRAYRSILAQKLKEAGYRQSDVAKALGYNSPSAIGMMLRGSRSIGREELLKMCELAGISLVELAGLSDDLKITKTTEALEGAEILDSLPPDQLAAAIAMLRALRGRAG